MAARGKGPPPDATLVRVSLGKHPDDDEDEDMPEPDDGDEPETDGDEALQGACDEFLEAIESGDKEAACAALKSFFQLADKQPHQEGPDTGAR